MAADQMRRAGWPLNPIIYQVYPRSFRDSTGSGEGDLKGVLHSLDHIASTGADAIWLSPVYASPMCDGGYDISDHCAIDPRFGTIEDLDHLIEAAHAKGLRVMMDQVFNHTSDTHRWFAASCAGDPAYRDYYVWADPCADGSPPSNWIGVFGKPAWRWVPQRRQYCLHQFLPCQPSLNHTCPAVLDELKAIITFWRARGVDGFRFDAITALFHDPKFRDNPDAGLDDIPMNLYAMQTHKHDMMPDDCAAFAADLRKWAGGDMFLIGEINASDTDVATANAFSGVDKLDAAYTTGVPDSGTNLRVLTDDLKQNARQGGLAWWLNSHDKPRMISRAGDGSARDARMFAALLLALPGPILILQGDELGQRQAELPLDAVTDPFDLAYWPNPPGRDGARAPMNWDTEAIGNGFSTGEPWLPLANAEDGGVVQQNNNADSVLNFYRKSIRLRRDLGLDRAGIDVLEVDDTWLSARLNAPDGGAYLLLCNMESHSRAIPSDASPSSVLLSSVAQVSGKIPARSTSWWRIE